MPAETPHLPQPITALIDDYVLQWSLSAPLIRARTASIAEVALV